MLAKSQIIVLHTIKHGDSGMVVQCYSNIYGKQSLYLKLLSKHLGKFANIHRLSVLDIITYSNGTSSMPIIKEVLPVFNLGGIRTNIYKNTMAIFISELLCKSIREVEANNTLFEFLKASIGILNSIEEGMANFHIHFMVHLSKMLGFKPLDNYSYQMPLFCINTACFTEAYLVFDGQRCIIDQSRTTTHFKAEESLLLHTILNTAFTNISSIKCTGELRLAFAKQMIIYISHHLGINIEIKSLDVLHEVFK
ncbi:MAG: DNA repair protein RecO [Bacteroidales bacterium]